jgi:hypothetical protein
MPEGGFAEVMENALAAIESRAGNVLDGMESRAAAFLPEVGAGFDRMVAQGAAELASALFGGSNAYVAYGEGQKAMEIEATAPAVEAMHIEAPQQQQERGGIEM